MRLLIIWICLLSISYCLTIEIPVNEIDYQITKKGQFDRIDLGTPQVIDGAAGLPELPVITYSYLLPGNQNVIKIDVNSMVWQELGGQYYLYPIQKPASIETAQVFTEPDLIAYTSPTMAPASPLNSLRCGNLRGYRILQIQIFPFQYLAAEKKLSVLKKLSLDIVTKNDIPGFAPRRTTGLGQHIISNFLSKIIMNKEVVNRQPYKPFTSIQENEKDSLASDFPSLIGPPVDLLIITTDDQIIGYNAFAEYKRTCGYNTVVKTMSWIRQYYSGHNDAERMRNFIKEAYQLWGVTYILLGGDDPVVPTAQVWIDRTVIFSGLWLPIASDLYFCDLDGSWNEDGDDLLGEVEDSVDLYPDVFVGRLPSHNNAEVFNYLLKEQKYYKPCSISYQTKALAFSSNLETNWPGLPWAIDIMGRLPFYWTKCYLDESLGNLTHETLYDSIHSGFNVMVGVGHGDVNQMDIRHCSWPRLHITNFFYDSLSNDPLYAGLLTVVTCYTNPFHGDCMGEHWVMNPIGGGLAYQGPTSTSEGNIHREYVKYFVDLVLSMTLAEAHCLSKLTYIPSAQNNNWFRVHQLSLSLMGDPTIKLWNNYPPRFNSLVTTPDTVCVGIDTVTVEVDVGVDPSRFSVVLYKPGEVFIIDSTQNGSLMRVIETETAGYLHCGVQSDGYVAYRDSLLVSGMAGYVDYRGHVVRDSLGNGNGIVNPGEEIGLQVEIGNGGGSVCSGVWARLVSYDSMVVVLSDSVWYGDINAGELILGMPFGVMVGDDVGDGVDILFGLEMHGGSGVVLDSFEVQCYAASIMHFGQAHGGLDTVWVLPGAVNIGHELSDSVFGHVVGVGDSVIIVDSVVSFGTIRVGDAVNGLDSLRFIASGVISYNYELRSGGDIIANYPVVLADVFGVESLVVSGGNGVIKLRWAVLDRALGYRVYRKIGTDEYALMNKKLIAGCYFEDYSVLPAINYEYYVIAVDSGYNIGLSSDTVLGRLNPPAAAGWPQVVYDFIFSSPNFGDIDPSYPGLEIAVCGWDGCLYAWHCDGTKLGNNDGRLFSTGSYRIWCSPAIGDINNDGLTDVVFTVQRSTNNLYAVTYTPGDSQAVALNGWPKTLPGSGTTSSPVLADIDEDGDLEIFVTSSYPAKLYAFHHDGIGVYDSLTGLLAPLFGNHKGGPAIGDINNDGHLEIACGGGSESNQLFVFDRYGRYLAPFPVAITPNQCYSCVLGNIVGDGCLEICFYAGNPSNTINVVNCQGVVEWQFPILADYLEMAPALADINDDDLAEVFLGYNDGLDAGLIAFDNNGNILPGYPIRGHDASSPIIADLNSDGIMDVATGTTEWAIQAYDTQGRIVPGFPILLEQSIKSSPAVFDIDGDLMLELMVSCYDFAFHVFDLNASHYEWPCYKYDPYNSGCYPSGFFPVDKDRRNEYSVAPSMAVFPSPFTKSILISFNVPGGFKNCSIKIYDVSGRLVKDLTKTNKIMTRTGNILWNGEDDIGRMTASGIYFIQLNNDLFNKTCKIIKIQ